MQFSLTPQADRASCLNDIHNREPSEVLVTNVVPEGTPGRQLLIRHLDGIAKQVWYADDSAAASSLERLRSWWDLLERIGTLYGYFLNISRTHVLRNMPMLQERFSMALE